MPSHSIAVCLHLALVALLLSAAPSVQAQQVADPSFRTDILTPAYRQGEGPIVRVDRAHNNFHREDEHFALLADLLRGDGYTVMGLEEPLTDGALAATDVLVIVNALSDQDLEEWVLPTSPAFSVDEVAAIERWVHGGGSLLLVADHMPFPGAVEELGRAFGIEFMNGFAIVEADWDPLVFRRADGTLRAHPITDGRDPNESVDATTTFVSGQAFRAMDESVRPLLVFGPDVVSINPERAWVFDDTTPRVPVEGWLQGAAVEAGAGRVAVFGEAAMFAAQLVGPQRVPVGLNSPLAPENLQLLLNTMHWLSRAPGFALLRP